MRGRPTYDAATDRSARSDYWGVVLDAPDAPALARFYATMLGWRVAHETPEYCTLDPGEGVAYIAVQTAKDYLRPVWPNVAGGQQMMLHIDVEVVELDAAVADALALGARLAEYQPQENVRVLLDPAGHPFCLYRNGEPATG